MCKIDQISFLLNSIWMYSIHIENHNDPKILIFVKYWPSYSTFTVFYKIPSAWQILLMKKYTLDAHSLPMIPKHIWNQFGDFWIPGTSLFITEYLGPGPMSLIPQPFVLKSPNSSWTPIYITECWICSHLCIYMLWSLLLRWKTICIIMA